MILNDGKEFLVTYSNEVEYNKILEVLNKNGYRWNGKEEGSLLTHKFENFLDYTYLRINSLNNALFCIVRGDKAEEDKISFNEFVNRFDDEYNQLIKFLYAED